MIPSQLTRRFLVPCLVVVVVIALGAAFGRGVVARFTPASQGSTAEPGPTPTTAPLFKEYTAIDGFRVMFPGSPQIDRQSLPVEGQQVPYTIYSASVDRNRDYRAVIVYDYTGVPVSERDLSPEDSLDRVLQQVPGAQLVARGHTTLDGHDAVFGDYTALVGSQTVDCYIEIIQVGMDLYGVTSAGISRADFETFAASFHLTQS